MSKGGGNEQEDQDSSGFASAWCHHVLQARRRLGRALLSFVNVGVRTCQHSSSKIICEKWMWVEFMLQHSPSIKKKKKAASMHCETLWVTRSRRNSGSRHRRLTQSHL